MCLHTYITFQAFASLIHYISESTTNLLCILTLVESLLIDEDHDANVEGIDSDSQQLNCNLSHILGQGIRDQKGDKKGEVTARLGCVDCVCVF